MPRMAGYAMNYYVPNFRDKNEIMLKDTEPVNDGIIANTYQNLFDLEEWHLMRTKIMNDEEKISFIFINLVYSQKSIETGDNFIRS